MGLFDFFQKGMAQEGLQELTLEALPLTEVAGLPLPCRVLPKGISGQQRMDLWKTAKAEAPAAWPLLVRLDDTLREHLEMTRYADGPLPDVDAYCKPYIDEVLTSEECAELLGTEGDEGEGVTRFYSYDFGGKTQNLLVSVPCPQPWEVFKFFPLGGWNDCPEAGLMQAFCKELYETFGAVPAAIGSDTLELIPARRPTDEEAFPLALRMYAFCPDVVMQGVGSVWALADSLKQSDIWSFWWD